MDTLSDQPDTPATVPRILLHAERPVVTKRVVPTELVETVLSTSYREASIAEELAVEGIEVERVACDRIVQEVPPVRQEGTTTIFPVVEERIVVERRLILTEEVHVRRVRTARTHTQTVHLRNQDAVVTRTKIDDAPAPAVTMAETNPSVTPAPHNPERDQTMTDETIVAVYDTPAHATKAVADLKAAGITDAAITGHNDLAPGTTVVPPREEGFWASLFGGTPDHDTSVYERSVEAGASVVTVKVAETMADRAMSILESHHPVDIDERATTYGSVTVGATGAGMLAEAPMLSGTAKAPPVAATTPLASAADGTIQLAEERLLVGKRVVNMGGTRIRRFVVETPVEEQVTLHEERVTLDRRPVTDGRPITGADFTEKTIQMLATAEEAVVSKQAYVTEELALHKTATDRVETVRDTVRKEDVEIVEVPGDAPTSTTVTNPAKPAI